MANVDETAAAFSDPNFASSVRLYLVPESEEDDTVPKRARSEVRLSVVRSDGATVPQRMHIEKLNDDDVETFDAGDAAALRGLLAKLVNNAINKKGL